jgi:predicted GNAT family N-acyltransferase
VELVIRLARADAERTAALDVRRRVFVEEQGVDTALERDAHDDTCKHLVAIADGRVVGAARHRRTERGVKLERVAVLAELRGCGVGSALVRHAIAMLPASMPIYVHAQQSALGFWERMAFRAEGAEFYEAGIPHRVMRRGGSP